MADDFERWFPLRSLSVDDLPAHGGVAAVYALRDSETGEILKFGKSFWLRRRIMGEYLGGVGRGTTQRINHELFANRMIERVELAWIATNDDTEACLREKEFRAEYKKVHGKRPRWDLRG
jgi:hypothetical protein